MNPRPRLSQKEIDLRILKFVSSHPGCIKKDVIFGLIEQIKEKRIRWSVQQLVASGMLQQQIRQLKGNEAHYLYLE